MKGRKSALYPSIPLFDNNIGSVFFFYKKPAFSQIEQKYLLDMGAGHEACNLCRSHNLFHF